MNPSISKAMVLAGLAEARRIERAADNQVMCALKSARDYDVEMMPRLREDQRKALADLSEMEQMAREAGLL